MRHDAGWQTHHPVGVVLVGVGLVALLLGRLGFRGMPGDVRVKTRNVQIYFPIVTCIVLSLAMTAILWLVQMFWRR